VGVGEASSQSYVCKAVFDAPRSAVRRHGLTQLLIGRDPLDEGLWMYLYNNTTRYGRRGVVLHAISAADLALWDLRGKALGKPVHELMGGAKRTTVRAYASYLFGPRPAATADLAREAVDLGLTAAKFGWGPFGEDLKSDVAHVEAARFVLGARDLMVDAGLAFTVESALERAHALAPLGIGWFEEPLSQDDLKGYTELCAQSPVPIAAGEIETTVWGYEQLIECGLAVLQPDVAICGGLTVAAEVSRLAAAYSRRVVPHCFSTGINLAASLHWMAAQAEGDLVEYCLRPSPLLRKLVRNLPPLVDGRVPVPMEPGLGVELDEGIIEQYRVA
jgi:L-rhamnonate dehydratase